MITLLHCGLYGKFRGAVVWLDYLLECFGNQRVSFDNVYEGFL